MFTRLYNLCKARRHFEEEVEDESIRPGHFRIGFFKAPEQLQSGDTNCTPWYFPRLRYMVADIPVEMLPQDVWHSCFTISTTCVDSNKVHYLLEWDVDSAQNRFPCKYPNDARGYLGPFKGKGKGKVEVANDFLICIKGIHAQMVEFRPFHLTCYTIVPLYYSHLPQTIFFRMPNTFQRTSEVCVEAFGAQEYDKHDNLSYRFRLIIT
ncbi:hypothetical protein T440DRAFT_482945 [Plenodomus tracheiphilus IPT5]|uniref:Uncharacterized protein n=1 Tax=Plenodomus tracheiphilus IPT5 TaxID=1408161 RepID=A0A6A7AS27_9PLEO|nr:hypothetical protein T440DRAFT_482945 [Plenodomus tracheiphilus IPT5]